MTDAQIILDSNGQDLAIKHVIECLSFFPDTGIFVWAVNKGSSAQRGMVAGSLHSTGYVCIQIDGKIYRAHRLAWFYVNGTWPDGDLDHINGNKSDNRIANLRVATCSENQANVGRRKDNKSGFKGVSLHGTTGKWSATIQHQNKRVHLGLFETPEAAFAAYRAASASLHGQFARAA